MKELSARTRAEMVCGARTVQASAAMQLAQHYEELWHSRRTRNDINVLVLSSLVGDDYAIETIVRWNGVGKEFDEIKFPDEPVDVYPSDTLRAQLMLVL